MVDDAEAREALKAWVRTDLEDPNLQRSEVFVVKHGPQVYKTVSMLYFGRSADEISHRRLVAQAYSRSSVGGGYAFEEKPDARWYCKDDEIDHLVGWLNADRQQPEGDYFLVDANTPAASLISAVDKGVIPQDGLNDLILAIGEDQTLIDILASAPKAGILVDAVQLRRHRQALTELGRLIRRPGTPERELHGVLRDNWWIFGGRYVRQFDRRQFTVLDELDIALERVDGVLHVIELKRADVRHAVVPYRNHHALGADVTKAVNQAMNYLRNLDKQRDTILADHDVDCERAFADIVIGHPDHNGHPDVSSDDFRAAIRMQNSHMSRIRIVTYEDLLRSAETMVRHLQEEIDEDERDAQTGRVPAPPDMDDVPF